MPVEQVPLIQLRHGITEGCTVEIPQVGFGTYRLKKATVVAPLSNALSAGYPMLDTASVYDNEREIAAVVQRHQEKHASRVFIVTKLWRSHQGSPDVVKKHVAASVRRLGGRVDLFLMHWPGPGEHRFKKYKVPKGWSPATRNETWATMVDILKSGSVGAVGVSNFSTRHLTALQESSSVVPAVNQVEMHPFLIQRELRAYCARAGIVVMAYCSLGAGNQELLTHPVIVAIAEEVQRSVAQVLLRWAIQHNVVILPCSTNVEHILENAALWSFQLTDDHISQLDSLDKGKRFAWKGVDPDTIP
ncbi:NADP-dependent oxidoreductase domain-containing protein [Powellomyces hirtus]|nr:NADP-dependent oxidoreductase domain-containing protein [Powellomyces hirtus]